MGQIPKYRDRVVKARNVIRVKCAHFTATWRTAGTGGPLYCADCKRWLPTEHWTEIRVSYWKGKFVLDNGIVLSTGIVRKGPKAAMKDAEGLGRDEGYIGLGWPRVVKYTTLRYLKGRYLT